MTATIIDVSYIWTDQPGLVRHGRVALADRKLTVEEFDALLDREDVFYIFEAGESPLGHNGEFKILSMEGVV